MSSFWDRFESNTRKEIYEREVRAQEADCREDFELAGVLVFAVETNNGSEIMCEGEDKECYILHTNKSYNFWHGMEGKEVFLRGSLLRKDSEERLIVLHAIPCRNAKGLAKFSNEQLLKFEPTMKHFAPDMRETLYNQLADLESWDDSEKLRTSLSISAGIEEMELMFGVMKHLLPKEVVEEVQRCIGIVKAGARGATEKENCRKTMYYLLSYPWWGNDEICDKEQVEARLDETHVGLKYAKKELLKEIVGVNASVEKIPRIILLVGPSGSGKTSLARSYFDGMGKVHSELNLARIKDEVLLAGTGKEYENGRPGNVFLRLHHIGNGGGLILDNVDQTNPECMDALNSLLDKKFVDHFLMVPVDMSKVWIVMTAKDINDVSPIFMAKVDKVIQMDSYTKEEKSEIINRVLVPRYCKEYQIEENGTFTEEVCREIMRFAAGKSIQTIEQIVQDVFLAAKDMEETFPQITLETFGKYYSLGEPDKLKELYATTYAEYDTKVRGCFHLYPKSVQERNAELLDMLTYGTDDDKAYASKALKVTANILRGENEPIHVHEIRKALDETHYGMEEVKNAVCRNVASREVVRDSKIKVMLLDGCAGVGKTSIARTVAKAMNRPFVKISLNGISDGEDLKGGAKSYKDAQPGLIPRNLAKEGVGSYHAVVLLDEVDKMGVKNGKNDPYAALHDILDSDNGGYYDQNLECFVETKNIIFILTSNDKGRLPDTILDRCEVIDVGGYSLKQKRSIVLDYVIPGMTKRYQVEHIQMKDDALDMLLKEYCVSLGVRDAERALEKIIENKAVYSDENQLEKHLTICKQDVKLALGGMKNRNNEPVKQADSQCGNARALAVAGNYGVWFDIQVASNEYGEEPVKVTGLAQGSFAESIDVAKTLVCNRMQCAMPKIHIHATSEGIAKDGPSAGLTIFSCMMSYMKKEPLPNVAFTGAVDLFGNVKKIGGAELKLKAAERAGVEKVYMPKENYEELCDSNEIENHDVKVIPITHVDEIVEELFGKGA